MSAEQPPQPEQISASTETEPAPSPEAVAERNAVPPTPEAPMEEVESTRERLARTAAASQPTAATSPTPQTVATPAALRGSFSRIASGTGTSISKGFKMGGGFLFGLFGYIFVHMIWHGLKNLPSFGGGGGNSKPSGGGGGGHH